MTDEFQDSWVEVATVDSFRTSHLVTRLKHDKKYYFAVSAENEKGSGDKAATEKPIALKQPISKLKTHYSDDSLIRTRLFPVDIS